MALMPKNNLCLTSMRKPIAAYCKLRMYLKFHFRQALLSGSRCRRYRLPLQKGLAHSLLARNWRMLRTGVPWSLRPRSILRLRPRVETRHLQLLPQPRTSTGTRRLRRVRLARSLPRRAGGQGWRGHWWSHLRLRTTHGRPLLASGWTLLSTLRAGTLPGRPTV